MPRRRNRDVYPVQRLEKGLVVDGYFGWGDLMVLHVRAVDGRRDGPLSIGQLFRLASGGRQELVFPALPRRNAHNLLTGRASNVSVERPLVRAVGLISCAAVCFFNSIPSQAVIGYALHANAGSMERANFDAAIAAIAAEPPYHGIWTVYAHPELTDPGYQHNLDKLVTWGLPTGHVLEVTDLRINSFAMNSNAEIGY